MTYTKPTLIAVALAASLFVLPATASTQDDVQTCRAAIATQSNIDMSTYRLRFERVDGITSSKARTIYLKAVNTDSQQSFTFSCTLNKNNVAALSTTDIIRYAAR